MTNGKANMESNTTSLQNSLSAPLFLLKIFPGFYNIIVYPSFIEHAPLSELQRAQSPAERQKTRQTEEQDSQTSLTDLEMTLYYIVGSDGGAEHLLTHWSTILHR